MKGKSFWTIVIIVVICIFGWNIINDDSSSSSGGSTFSSGLEKSLAETLPEDLTTCYCIDNNGEKVSINSSSIMPSYEIIICPSYMTYEEPVITGQTHTITFTCPSTARVISYDDWTLTDGVYTKEVKGGNSIGLLPNITIISGFAFSYWYYINADGYQVMVNSGTQMPSYDITLLYAVSTYGYITI